MGEASSCTRGMFPRFGIEGIEVRELSDREREMLIQEATTAWRSRRPDGRTLEHHMWADLDATARQTVLDEAFIMRVLEAALDRDAYSTMVRAVAAATARG
jgi:hypothetical protein